MPDDDYFFGGTEELIDSEKLGGQMARNYAELTNLEQQLAEYAALSYGLAAKISELKNVTMPKLLDDMATTVWRDPISGRTIEKVPSVNSAQPKDMEKRRELFDALQPLNVDEILAQEFIVNFTPGDKRARLVREFLGLGVTGGELIDDEDRLTNEEADLIASVREKLGLGALPSEEKLGCHPARFKSWLLKQLEDGRGDVLTSAGIWHGSSVKITMPKKKKAAKK